MLLLEEMLNNIGIDWVVQIHFIMDEKLCAGDFRKAQLDNFEGENIIFTERLLHDYIKYTKGNQGYFEDLGEHLEETDGHQGDILRRSVLNIMVAFLMEQGTTVNRYFKVRNIPEVVYNFYKETKYYERYSVEDKFMNPVNINLEEKTES